MNDYPRSAAEIAGRLHYWADFLEHHCGDDDEKELNEVQTALEGFVEEIREKMKNTLKEITESEELEDEDMSDMRLREARKFAREIMALDTEMERRSCNPDDPGNAEVWADRWGELVERARKYLACGND